MSSQNSIQNGHTFEPVTLTYFNRLQDLKAFDKAKNDFFLDLIGELDSLKNQQAHASDCIRKYEEARAELDNLRLTNARDAYILFLIDGDGMIFNEDLLRKGEEGGREAARELSVSAHYYVHSSLNFPAGTFPPDTKIVCRVYANVRGLADVCARAGLVESPVALEDFTRGFTRGKTLFDFVDVGPGKDRADEKIQEHFRLNLYDPHCRQIFVGCSHDNGFVRMLEEPALEPTLIEKITLLEGVPFEKEFGVLPFARTDFGNLFRRTKIQVPSFYSCRPDTPQSPEPGTLTRTTTNSSATPSIAQPIAQKSSPLVKLTQVTWANKAAAAALRPPTPPSRASPAPEGISSTALIPRNRKGQRIDPPLINFNKMEVDRVKAIKMCNVHHLLKGCGYGDSCTHNHSYKPTKDELETLKFIARMAPCIHGTGCPDVTCIYGHRCPFPERPKKTGRKGMDEDDDGKNCIFGKSCKFDREMHGIDMNVVKTMVIR